MGSWATDGLSTLTGAKGCGGSEAGERPPPRRWPPPPHWPPLWPPHLSSRPRQRPTGSCPPAGSSPEGHRRRHKGHHNLASPATGLLALRPLRDRLQIAQGVGAVIDPEGRGLVVDIDHIGRNAQAGSRRKRLRPCQAIGRGDDQRRYAPCSTTELQGARWARTGSRMTWFTRWPRNSGGILHLSPNFVGGPATAEAWEAAYQVALHVMGLARSHPLSRYIIHVYPRVV